MRWIPPALLIVLVAGCAPDVEPPTSDPAEPVWLPDEAVSAVMEAGRIEYVPDPPGTDTWQTPAQTAELGQGDCEDICIYLQHLLAKHGIASDVVFGLRNRYAKTGHAWIELLAEDRLIIVEPRNAACYRRDLLPAVFYVPAEGIDSVAQKVTDYHARTGVWVSLRYRPDRAQD